MSKVEIRTLNGAYFKDVQAREEIQNLEENIKNLAPVTSVNGKTGAVTLSASDVGAASVTQFNQLSAEIDAIGTQEEIVQQVIAALGTPVFGTVDADKNIILTGTLAEGTYTVKYEDAEGNETTIGTLTAKTEPKYTNLLPTAIGYDGSVLDGVGYIDGYRLTSVVGTNDKFMHLSADATHFATGCIAGYTNEDAENMVPFYVKGVNLDASNLTNNSRIWLVASNSVGQSDYGPANLNNTAVNGVTIEKLGDLYYKITPNYNFKFTNGYNNISAKFVRFSMPGTGKGVIITVNEPIE